MPQGSPIAQVPYQRQVPWEFGINQRIQTKQIKTSRVNIKNAIILSAGANTTGTIGAGSTSIITNTLTPNIPHANEINFAMPFAALYQGTAAIQANQIWPTLGASGTWGNWTIQAGYDYDNFAFRTTPGSVNSNLLLTIHNNQGIAGTVYYISIFKYLQYNNGTVT